MPRNYIPLFASILSLLLCSAHAGNSLPVDSAKSKVSFTIQNKSPKATEFSPVKGSFKDFSGTVVFDKDVPENTAVEMKINTTSVDTGNAKRDDHLRNQDFFKVKEFPSMTFKSKSAKQLDDGRLEVVGDFTLLGVTREISTIIDKTADNAASTSFEIKRSDYGMDFRIPDTADEVSVSLVLVASTK